MATMKEPSEKRQGAGPRLFLILLGFIVATLVIFLILSPIHGGSSTGPASGSPASQR
jgi:hypothetical protein